jgi:uracil-DNA glycosylase family 4
MNDAPVLDPADALEALMAWYEAMGVDAVLDDAPKNRFALAEAAKQAPARPGPAVEPPRPTARPAAPAPAHTVPGDEAVMAARAAASSAESLDALRAMLDRFDGCNLKLTARNLVFGDGSPTARLMLVGEAPGREEDLEGRPFVGRSGQLLDRMLKAAGFSREDSAYIANVVYWRPPGNREPSDVEVAICRPFILRQIELVDPDVLVFLGAQPLKALVGGETARAGIRRIRGQWLEFDTGRRVIPALPTFHPAYLLRQPLEKRMVWRDLLSLRDRLAIPPGQA